MLALDYFPGSSRASPNSATSWPTSICVSILDRLAPSRFPETVSREVCPRGGVVAFPEKTKNRKEDLYTGQNPRRDLKGGGRADQAYGEGSPTVMRKERAMYLEEHPIKANELHSGSPHPRRPSRGPACPPRTGRRILSQDPPLSASRLPGTLKAILALYAAGVSTRAISRHTQVVGERCAWRERP